MPEQEESIILTDKEKERYENIVVERWLRNSERVNQQIKRRDYKSEFRFGPNTQAQLKIGLLHWLQSPRSFNAEKGILLVGDREVEEGEQSPTLVTNGRFIELSGGAIYAGETNIKMDLAIVGYYLSQLSSDPRIEPVAIVHTHPRRLPDKALSFSPSDNRYVTNFLAVSDLPPIRGIYLGLAALQAPNQVALKMRTAVYSDTVITKSLIL